MGRTFSMRWLRDGSVKLSKHAPPILQSLVAEGHFKQSPLSKQKAKPLPRGFKPANETVNEYGVERDQIWESLDARDVVDGQPRQLRVLVVGEGKVLVESLRTGHRTSIDIKRFNGKTIKGFKRVVPAPSPALVQAEA